MRSRFSAYALEDAAYLLASWHPSTRPPTVPLDPSLRWTRLQVLSATGGLLDRVRRARGVLREVSGLVAPDSST